MSLSGILGNALSGLQASQAGLRASSNNVANVNTPGYARTIAMSAASPWACRSTALSASLIDISS